MALVSADSRIAELLTELHQLIKQTQEERSRSEHNLVNIQKTHERMQTENKISPYYRTKLRGLYTTAKADAEAECKPEAPLGRIFQRGSHVSSLDPSVEIQAYPFPCKVSFPDFHCFVNPSLYQMDREREVSFNSLKCFSALVKISPCGKFKKFKTKLY
uniref:SAGA complex associated factor 29 n=1 Tax=Ovis aries TaxID=9940 RepID=A0AC11E0Q4_SHEEP